VVIVLIGLLALAIMIRLPATEGRAANLDMVSIYTDPFVLYGYAASIPFFIALYQAFKLIGYIRQNQAFSLQSVKALKRIKYCAILLSIFIVLAGVAIKLFHDKNDDPAGFLAMCMLLTIVSIAVAATAAVFEKKLQKGVKHQIRE
jgi:hypothetical protein